jgi:hypothetical protein
MDVMIKRKLYLNAIQFLNEKSDDNDWKVFIESLKLDKEFNDFFDCYICNLKCVFTLKLFLVKLFCFNSKDKSHQDIVYNVIDRLINSQSEFNEHLLIKNLLIVQVLKLCVFNDTKREKLREIITKWRINEQWLIDLLDSFQYYQEIGLIYEISEDYGRSLLYYTKCNLEDKVKQLTEIIQLKNNKTGSFSQEEEYNNMNIN